MNKCIFLDRDGVLNEEVGTYVFKKEEFKIINGVKEAISKLKQAGYLLIVITNQSGIAKGLYTKNEVFQCHELLQNECDNSLDDLYFCPHHEDYNTASLLKKPNSLMIEKAMAKHNIDPQKSWFVGDQERDLQAGANVGVSTLHITQNQKSNLAKASASNLLEAVNYIL